MTLIPTHSVRSRSKSAFRKLAQVWRNVSSSWRSQRPERIEQLTANLAYARIPPSTSVDDASDPPWTPFLPISQCEEASHSAMGSRRRWSRP
jgi:hypothetical protein